MACRRPGLQRRRSDSSPEPRTSRVAGSASDSGRPSVVPVAGRRSPRRHRRLFPSESRAAAPDRDARPPTRRCLTTFRPVEVTVPPVARAHRYRRGAGSRRCRRGRRLVPARGPGPRGRPVGAGRASWRVAHCETAGARAAACVEARCGVFEDHCFAGCDAQPPAGQEIALGVRFAVEDVLRGHHRGEVAGNAPPRQVVVGEDRATGRDDGQCHSVAVQALQKPVGAGDEPDRRQVRLAVQRGEFLSPGPPWRACRTVRRVPRSPPCCAARSSRRACPPRTRCRGRRRAVATVPGSWVRNLADPAPRAGRGGGHAPLGVPADPRRRAAGRRTGHGSAGRRDAGGGRQRGASWSRCAGSWSGWSTAAGCGNCPTAGSPRL